MGSYFQKFLGLLSFLIILSITNINAQTPVEFKNLPVYINKPQWIDLVDWTKPNIFFIDSLFSNWRATKISLKSDSNLNEDPFESAFFRWRNRVEPYIIENGDTSINEYNKILNRYQKNTNGNRTDNIKSMSVGNGSWTLVGPSKTYSNGIKVMKAQVQKIDVKPRAYYLAATGNDNNAGTAKSPWKTIGKINTVRLRAGDSVLFKAEQTFKGTLKVDSMSGGVLESPVVIGSFGNGIAEINAGNSSALVIEKAAFITIKNLKLTGSGRKKGNAGDGITVLNSSNIVVDELDVKGFRNAGVSVYASFNIRIVNVYAHDNGFAGISVSGEYQHKESCSNIYIGYCKADNNPGNPMILNNHSGNGIIAGECSKLLIEYCSATNNGWDMPRIGNGPVGIWCYEADSAIIQHCLSYRNKTSKGGDDGGGFDLDGGVTNSIIQYCLSYENQGSGYGIFQYAGASNWYNNIIRYNISEDDGTVSAAGAGIYIWNSSDDSLQFYNCIVHNNTIYNNKGSAISYAGQSARKGFSFYNNIFIATDSLLKGKRESDIFLGNNWWSLKNNFNIEGLTDLNTWSKQSGQELLKGTVVGLNINPGFNMQTRPLVSSCADLKLLQRYKVKANSPLRNQGLDLHRLFGIEPGGIDFNSQPAPEKGIGACF